MRGDIPGWSLLKGVNWILPSESRGRHHPDARQKFNLKSTKCLHYSLKYTCNSTLSQIIKSLSIPIKYSLWFPLFLILPMEAIVKAVKINTVNLQLLNTVIVFMAGKTTRLQVAIETPRTHKSACM